MVCRAKRKRVGFEDDQEDASGDDEELTTHTPKRFKRELVPKYYGMLGVNPEIWKTMTDEHMTFIQDWNYKVKHDEDPKTLPVPKGIIIKAQTRRIPHHQENTIKLKLDQETDIKESEIDYEPNNRKRKSIGFPINSGDKHEPEIESKVNKK